MNPRRLIPYAIILLILAGTYAVLLRQQTRQTAREEAAKKVFQVLEQDIAALAVIRDGREVRLAKKDRDWQLLTPLQVRADQAVVDGMLAALAKLQKERDLGAPKDLKAFGLDKPLLVVEFSAQGRSHRLAVGSQAPGTQDYYYALKDQEPEVLLLRAAAKDSLDRDLTALRDKTLLAFEVAQVKEVKIRTGKTRVDLEKTGPQTWRWTGREDFKVRTDRVETLLRQLHAARVKEFPEQLPKNYRAIGLGPKAQSEITLVTAGGLERLLLGVVQESGMYVRKGPDGPVVLVDKSLADDIAKAASSLEDRRLWGGPVTEADKAVWGPPNKLWTAVKGKESWELKGPEGAALKQPAARVELALWKLQNLEYVSLMQKPGNLPAAPEAYVLEVFDGSGQALFRLEELGRRGNLVEVKAQKGDRTVTAIAAAKNFSEIQDDLARLITPPPGK